MLLRDLRGVKSALREREVGEGREREKEKREKEERERARASEYMYIYRVRERVISRSLFLFFMPVIRGLQAGSFCDFNLLKMTETD